MSEAQQSCPLPPISAGWSMLDDYPGELWRCLSARLIVSPRVDAYRLQERLPGIAPAWSNMPGLGRAKLPRIVERFGGALPGLAAFCEGLPADPAEAASPALLASRAAFVAAFDACRILSPSYAWVIRQETQLRLAVDRSRQFYCLQSITAADFQLGLSVDWRSQISRPSLGQVRDWMVAHVYEPERRWARGFWLAPTSPQADAALQDRVAAFLDGLPDDPGAVALPPMPEVPADYLAAYGPRSAVSGGRE